MGEPEKFLIFVSNIIIADFIWPFKPIYGIFTDTTDINIFTNILKENLIVVKNKFELQRKY